MAKYTKDDKTCPHCGGEITCHYAGCIIYWCDICGSNDPDSPPMIGMTFHIEQAEQNQSAEGK